MVALCSVEVGCDKFFGCLGWFGLFWFGSILPIVIGWVVIIICLVVTIGIGRVIILDKEGTHPSKQWSGWVQQFG